MLQNTSYDLTSEHREGPPKARRLLLRLTCVMFLVNTGLFVSGTGDTLSYFAWALDVVTESMPCVEDRFAAAVLARFPFQVCANLFEITNASCFIH